MNTKFTQCVAVRPQTPTTLRHLKTADSRIRYNGGWGTQPFFRIRLAQSFLNIFWCKCARPRIPEQCIPEPLQEERFPAVTTSVGVASSQHGTAGKRLSRSSTVVKRPFRDRRGDAATCNRQSDEQSLRPCTVLCSRDRLALAMK